MQALVDDLLQLGSYAEAAVTLGVHDPGEALVELMTSEFLVALGRGVVVGEKGVKRGDTGPIRTAGITPGPSQNPGDPSTLPRDHEEATDGR